MESKVTRLLYDTKYTHNLKQYSFSIYSSFIDDLLFTEGFVMRTSSRVPFSYYTHAEARVGPTDQWLASGFRGLRACGFSGF